MRHRTFNLLSILVAVIVTAALAPDDCRAADDTGGAAAAPAAAGATPVPAGTVVLVEGDVQIVSAGAAARPARDGDGVREGDRVNTGHDGEVHLGMQDGGFIVLRADTQFVVERYQADGADDDHAIFRLVSGAMRSISGWIGRFNTRQDLIHTATATIGIRGTDHEVRIVAEGATEGDPGVYDRVYAGETYIATDSGTTPVSAAHAGFAGLRERGKPRLLSGIPVFFRPGPHEAEIARKHEEIQRHIEERRAARRKAVAAARQALKQRKSEVQAEGRQQRAEAATERATAEQHKRELRERATQLRDQVKQLHQQRAELKQRRAALADDVQAGRLSADQARERQQALKAEGERVEASQRALDDARKALQRDADGAVDTRFDAAQRRLKSLHDERLELRKQRDAVQAQGADARTQSRDEQRAENKRFREELRRDADPAQAPAPSPAPAPSASPAPASASAPATTP